LEMEFGNLEKEIKQREAQIQAFEEKKKIEFQRLKDDVDALRNEYEIALQQKGMTVAAKEKELANLEQEYQEKIKRYNEEGDEIEAGIRRMMQMSEAYDKDVAEKRKAVIQRMQLIKEEAMKGARNGAAKKK